MWIICTGATCYTTRATEPYRTMRKFVPSRTFPRYASTASVRGGSKEG